MKKVLWIACLLCLMPFLGYTQKHAGLATQDAEELFGPAPVSKELPSNLQLNGITRTSKDGSAVWAHAMFVPDQSWVYGVYYEIDENGNTTDVITYPDWYYSAAEYYYDADANSTPPDYPVWAYSEDYVAGFTTLNYDNGTLNNMGGTAVTLSMNDITYDYNHDRMLGMKYGRIYKVILDGEQPGSRELLYDCYTESPDNDTLMPIAIACDLDGTLYFVSLSKAGESSKLYKFDRTDEDLDNPIAVADGADLGWAAEHIQTMAFNHNTRELFWWACDPVGNTQLKQLDKETGTVIRDVTPVINTEIAGLIFQFDYVPYDATCINTEGTLLLDNGQTSNTYKPGQDVYVTIAETPTCKSLVKVIVMNADDHNDIIAEIPVADLVNNQAHFVMPAHAVHIDAEWEGDIHNIELAWLVKDLSGNIIDPTGATIPDALTCSVTQALYTNTVTVTYDRPIDYYLASVVAVDEDGNELTPTVNSDNSKVSFVMPCGDITITAEYVKCSISHIADICQFEGFKRIPNAGHALGLGHKHIYTFTDPNGTAHNYGDGTMTNNELDDIMRNLTFDIPGPWSFTSLLVNETYGNFPMSTSTFNVIRAPKAIHIEGEQHNCDSIGTILLTVVPEPDTAIITGTFEWYKDDVLIATIDTCNYYLKDGCRTEDAGNYNVVFTPGTANATTAPTENVCSKTLEDPYPVNVATLPNKPKVRFYVSDQPNPICHNSSVELEWAHEVLFPDEYIKQWCIIDENGDWQDIPGATGRVYETTALTENTTFGLRIRYDGEYNACYAESDPFVVEVKPQTSIDVEGDRETCQKMTPGTNPYIDSTYYSNCKWTFNNTELPIANGCQLHFENTTLNGELLDVAGTFTIKVEADDPDGCTIQGEFQFIINPAPEVTITNNVNPDIVAHYDDNPVTTLTVCAGSAVQLTANNAVSYSWDPTSETTETINIIPWESTTYSVTGTDESGCEMTTTIAINVTQRPEITWVTPSVDNTVISMILDDYQLEATPIPNGTTTTGYFTWLKDDGTAEIIENGILHPAAIGIDTVTLVYSYQDANSCDNEEQITVIIEKPYWTDPDKWDSLWYDDCLAHGGRFEITNPAQMGAFAAYVNGLNGVYDDFADDTVWITNNIDLQELPYFYRPLNNFAGVLDGNGKVITNMVILENELDMNINGFIRNIGVKDAKITSVTTPCTISVLDGARVHNSYITMPDLNNVTANFQTTGEIRNVYYYGPVTHPITHQTVTTSIYMENSDNITISPIAPTTLLHSTSGEGTNGFTGILEEWVWVMNEYTYMAWKTDYEDPEEYDNYGYPLHDKRFMHHHYIYTEYCDFGKDTLTNVRRRTIFNPIDATDSTNYVYAMSGETITYTFLPETEHIIVDSIECHILTVEPTTGTTIADSSFFLVGPGYEYDIVMPTDLFYEPAYQLTITPYCRRDYWTDDGYDADGNPWYNYDPNWFTNCGGNTQKPQFVISNNTELAALAYMCDFGGYDFTGDTILITGGCEAEIINGVAGNIVGSDELLDMSAHMWRPIYNFNGVINGQHYIVDNLYIREEVSAMFVNCNGSIINFGIQDIDLPEEGEIASYVYNTSNNYNASVINSFATTDPAAQLQYEIAVGDGVTVTNTYTLDEGGAMIDHNHNFTNFTALREWVINISTTVPGIFWDWKHDTEPINYYYPIHSNLYDGGWQITYDPDSNNPVNGFISGPTIAHGPTHDNPDGDEITVNITPDWCYDLETLTVDMGNGEVLDIYSTKKFNMPNNPVTVHATFAPKNLQLTVHHVDMDGNPLVDANGNIIPNDVYPNMHIDDDILVSDYALPADADYELVTGVANINQDIQMPCEEFYDIYYYYQGKEHNMTVCELEYDDMVVTVNGTVWNPTTSLKARFTETVTVTVTPPDGVSVMGIDVIDGNNNAVTVTTVSYGTYTFVMPTTDVTICPYLDEEYWDDYGIADISWFFNHEGQDEYTLDYDSALGGLAALVTGRDWLVEKGYYTQEQVETFDFSGVTIKLESKYNDNTIDLSEHKWRPIGAQIESQIQFNGFFDGNGHVITNMRTVDITHYNQQYNGSCQALFGTVGPNGVVYDVTIEGTAEGRYFTAGLVGVNYGIIANCVADVEVKSEFQAGGIVCNNQTNAYVINSYCISDKIECLAAAKTDSPDGDSPTNNFYVGGVASFNQGTIINCHSAAKLVKGNGWNPISFYGGVVGVNKGEISYCYWTVNPIEEGYGQNTGTFENCAVIDATTTDNLNGQVAGLASMFELELNNWIDGSDYPVFDLSDRNVMNSADHEINVVIYPNPTKGDVKIFSNNIQRVTVYNMFGQMVLDTETNGNETTVNMSTFTSGIYMVRITTAEGTATRNVVVE